ncbi:MAG TPA: xanthine dehydrogenase family protein molybdopterin-binding subunit [Streptosporangiaceae bacterium]
MPPAPRGRDDAWAKASGAARYVGDVSLPGMLHVALVRSLVPHARIARIDTKQAAAADGVTGVFTAADVNPATYGRSVRDIPILARDKVRFTGERVAAVVAGSRRAAEAAAALVEVTYDDLPAALSAGQAISPGAPLVHDQPWAYPRAAVTEAHGPNVQSRVEHGSRPDAEAALAASHHMIDQTYTTPSGHQGYLEPQACVAAVEDGRVRIWATNKSPYRLRGQLAECLDLDPASVEIEPVPLGGDFGGKGSPMDIPLCVELARLVGRPVKLVLRYAEDLTATNPRHPGRIRIQAGCDAAGRLTAVTVRALLNGGAYAGFKPLASASLHGIADCTLAYDVPVLFTEAVIAYTNTVPRGHMRSPGSPQAAFALESALDELAAAAGLDPAALRRRNLVPAGMPSVTGKVWAEARGPQTLDAALAQARHPAAVPPGWRAGTGLAVYAREAPALAATSIRLVPAAGGRIRAEVPIPETGTGSHTVVRNRLAAELAAGPEDIEVVHVATGELPVDAGVGASRVTVGMAAALSRAAQAWRDRTADEPVVVRAGPGDQGPGDPGTGGAAPAPVASYCAQVAQVAVDPATGQVKVLEILSAVDVGQIVHPPGHQMQIDGGTIMGYGFACLEDLAEDDGQITAANLGEFKLPSMNDAPVLRTVLVEGGQGVPPAGVKPVGELTNVAVAAAVANAVADATGCRIRDLPVTAEKVFWALHGPAETSTSQEGRPA